MTNYHDAGRTFKVINDDEKEVYGLQVWALSGGNHITKLPKEAMRDVSLALQAAYACGKRDLQKDIRNHLGVKQP